MQPIEVMLLSEMSRIEHELRMMGSAQARQVLEAELRHQNRRRITGQSRPNLFRFLNAHPRRA